MLFLMLSLDVKANFFMFEHNFSCIIVLFIFFRILFPFADVTPEDFAAVCRNCHFGSVADRSANWIDPSSKQLFLRGLDAARLPGYVSQNGQKTRSRQKNGK